MKLIPKSKWLRALLVFALVLFGPYFYSRILSPWTCVRTYEIADAKRIEKDPEKAFSIVAYNIAHGRGLAKSNLGGGNASARTKRLNDVANLLREMDSDVVVLNEIDFNAAWSHSVNQAEYLSKRAGYPFVAEQRNLDLRILFWKLSFGNAILSKHPIEKVEVVDFPEFSVWETILAGKKRGLNCTVNYHGKRINVIGAHLSHRSEELRVRSAKLLIDIARKSANPVLVAGDLNSTPSGFPQSGKDKSGRNALDTLDDSDLFQRRPERAPGPKELIFPSDKPKSVIDWILLSKKAEFVNYSVWQSQLSDHLPVKATVNLSTEPPNSEVSHF